MFFWNSFAGVGQTGRVDILAYICQCQSLSRVWLFATLWAVACQVPLSMGFSSKDNWSDWPFPSPGHLPDPGIEPRSPTLQVDAIPSERPEKAMHMEWVAYSFFRDLPEIGIKLGSPAFEPTDVGNLISASSAFSKSSLNIWKFTVHVLLQPGLENFQHYFTSVWDECNCAVVWAFFGIAFLWDWNENWPLPVLWPLLSFLNLLAYWVQHFYSIIFQDLK